MMGMGVIYLSLSPSPPLSQNQRTLSPLPQYQRPTSSSMPQGLLPHNQRQGSDTTISEIMSVIWELLTRVRVGDVKPPQWGVYRQV